MYVMPERESILIELAKADSTYQELLKKCGDLEKEYLRISNALPEKDKLLLDRYIGICEELEHQKVRLALDVL